MADKGHVLLADDNKLVVKVTSSILEQAGYKVDVAWDGIEAAIEEVGFENLNGRAVRDALTSTEFDAGGAMCPTTVSDAQPYWQPNYRVYEVQDGRLVGVSDWIEPQFYLD